jgi:hypothetical protein
MQARRLRPLRGRNYSGRGGDFVAERAGRERHHCILLRRQRRWSGGRLGSWCIRCERRRHCGERGLESGNAQVVLTAARAHAGAGAGARTRQAGRRTQRGPCGWPDSRRQRAGAGARECAGKDVGGRVDGCEVLLLLRHWGGRRLRDGR